MPTTDLTTPTTVLALFCGETDRDDVLVSMTRQLPPEGVTGESLRPRFNLMRATYRLLDSRVLEAAATALDQDVAKPLVAWLADFQNLREAAARTYGDTAQVVVELTEPTPFTSTQESEVTLFVGEDKVAAVTFRLELKVELGKTSAAVRRGAIEEIVCALCCASASFTLEGCPKPLWKPKPVSLPDVHLPVRPPFRVPLAEVPRPRPSSDAPEPRPIEQRPPVPGSGRVPGR